MPKSSGKTAKAPAKITEAPSAEVPAKRPRTFHEMLTDQPEPVRVLALRLRDVVLETLPDVGEVTYGGSKVPLTLYSLGGPTKPICGIQPSAGACLLYLHHIGLTDTSKLVIEGKGRHARHVRFESWNREAAREVRKLLLLARRRFETRAACPA